MTHFTPYTALGGGLLIGVAAVLLLYLNGRIAGISGILNGALARQKGDTAWRVAFLLGMLAGGGAFWWLTPHAFVPRQGFPLPTLLVAGFLVGFGTRLGSGCTSGHGVCGLGRRSLRSLVATATFVGFGMLTVYVTRHLLGGQP
ncbi:YeeE/YedE family protein [Immundisolibacter sp.]|uniref:YeeE/YedE family protein n=1 Tax=Immundisolibacter sp. TaxID=1934948 RepID=UPI002615BF4D|nr:YeeE/YedE family protein [Immundisolibacter sp.]MDD3650358.1 YeeE/YedE family protein [Immundisolibacter sp.]